MDATAKVASIRIPPAIENFIRNSRCGEPPLSGHLASFVRLAAVAFRKLSRGWREGGGDALEFTWRRCTVPILLGRRFSGSRASHPRAFLRFFAPNPKIPRILSSLRRKLPFYDPKTRNVILENPFSQSPESRSRMEKIWSDERIRDQQFSFSFFPLSSPLSNFQDRNCSWTRIKSISSESRWRPSTGNRESRTVARAGTERDARLSAARSRRRHPFSAPSRSLPRHFSPART